MKKIFIIWITVQLMFIGAIRFIMVNDVSRNIYQCIHENAHDFKAGLAGIIVPLAVFIPFDPTIDNYCK